MCRAFGHAWDEGAPDIRFTARNGHQQAARCERCATRRYQWLDWEGKPIAKWYEYEDNYSTVIPLTRAQAKIWLIDQRTSASKAPSPRKRAATA
jgi:hypothetical protein